MASKHKFSHKEIAIPVGIALGLLMALIIMFIGAAIYAYLISSEKAGWNGFGVPAILMLSSAAGAWTAVWKIKQRKLIVCGIFGISFFSILLGMTALFFGGQYEGMGSVVLYVLIGSSTALLLGILGNKRRAGGHKIPVYR